MSYWPYNSGDAGRAGPLHEPPPLPPRNNGRGPIGAPGAVPPPIPPRPAGFGYQPIRGSSTVETTSQPTGSSATTHRKPVTNSSRIDVQTPDISHFFPGGRIPPPPPRPEISSNPQRPLNAEKPNTSLSPATSRPQISADEGFSKTYSQENQVGDQTQQLYPTQASREHPDGAKNHIIDTKAGTVDNKLAEDASSKQEVTCATDGDRLTSMGKKFQDMGLENSSNAMPLNKESKGSISYHASSPQRSSNHDPTQPRKTLLPTQQSPSIRLPAADISTTSPTQSQTAKECISTDVTFAAVWYTHPRAPAYLICMNCYNTHIRGSQFRDEFQGTLWDDGKPRACKFQSARIKYSLWELAISSGSLDSLVEYMVIRQSVPDCRGQGGAKAGAGIKWYRTRNGDIPEMAVCQACYEDHILSYPRFGHDHFEPIDTDTIQRAPDQVWSCDIAVLYINREYRVRAPRNDWHSFVQNVPVRLSIQPCPGEKTIYPDGKGKRWFTPINGPQGLLICLACYCDYVLLTGQEGHWRDAGDNLVKLFGVSVACFFGHQVNVRILTGRMLDTNNYTLFWKAIDIVVHEPKCKGRIQNATSWYTLHSDPKGFEICKACYVTIAESMGIGHHFTPKAGIPPGSSIMCSFNPGVARFPTYMKKLLEMIYKQDPAPLEDFVKEFAFLPLCRRDTHIENAHWFGWNECTICAECHHQFIKGTVFAGSMPHQGTHVKGAVMCEMYSPRMRQLYLAACASDPPDPKPLLEYSLQRRAVFARTIPRARQILKDIELKMLQQQSAMNNSLFYSWSGNLWQNTLPVERTYGNSAIGYGYYNHMQIKGAEYSQQAAALGNEILGSPAHVADELRRQWRLVE